MDHAITDTPAETILHGALELSKNSWLSALQFPDRAQPSLYPIRGGDTVGLMAKLTAARDRWAKMSGKAPHANIDPIRWRESSAVPTLLRVRRAGWRCGCYGDSQIWPSQSTVLKMSPVLPARLSMHAAEWHAGTELPDIS